MGYRMPTVTVVLSTYNGQEYIKEQIDSLLMQEDVVLRINIRDDNSSDETIRIINEYHDDRIRLFADGQNLGAAHSFLKLLRECDESEYYAYCDQDDVWKPRKLIDAINMIKENDTGDAALYMSTYEVVDERLNPLFVRDMKFEIPFRIQDTILYRAPSACTMVFNHALREAVIESTPKCVRMHDYWTLLVAEAFHYRIVTDDRAQLMYRQHNNNTVGVVPSILTRIKRLMKSALKGENERWRQARDFYYSYRDSMPDDTKKLLKPIVGYRYSTKNRLYLMRDHRFRTGEMYYDILFVISVFLGKF